MVDEFLPKVNPVAIGRGAFADLEDSANLELPSASGFPSVTATVLYRKPAP